MVKEEMFDKIYSTLEKSLGSMGLRDFEVYFERVQSRNYESKDQALDSSLEAVQEGVALRVFQEGRVAYAYSTDLGTEALAKMAAAVASSLPWVDPEPGFQLASPAALPTVELKNFVPELTQIPNARKLEAAIAMEAAAKNFDPRVKYVRSSAYEEKIATYQLRNSRGVDVGYSRSRCQMGVMAVAEADGEAESGYEFDSAPGFEALDPEKIGRDSAERAVAYLGGTSLPSRRVPVLLDPSVAGDVLQVLAASFQGDSVFKKRSNLEGKLGEKLFSDLLNIEDNSLLPEGMASCPFDGEGMPSRRLPLVERGKIANFLLDRLYAGKLGLVANASTVRRGILRPPFLSYSNLRIPPGDRSDAQLYREVGSGILVTDVFGMHAANPVTGDFSVGFQGFLIEGGEKRGPVKKLALAGNLHRMMADLRAVGSSYKVQGQIGAPLLVIQEMAIGGS